MTVGRGSGSGSGSGVVGVDGGVEGVDGTDGVLGEVTIVVAGAEEGAVDSAALVARVRTLVDKGMRLKDAAGVVSEESGVSRRELYEAALER